MTPRLSTAFANVRVQIRQRLRTHHQNALSLQSNWLQQIELLKEKDSDIYSDMYLAAATCTKVVAFRFPCGGLVIRMTYIAKVSH